MNMDVGYVEDDVDGLVLSLVGEGKGAMTCDRMLTA
jgi:hypothetical protein